MENNLPLSGLSVVVTRPQHQADSLMAQLAAAGATAIALPTIEIIPCAKPSVMQPIMIKLRNYDCAIFLSPNAVWQTLPFWPVLPPQIRIISIGPGTTLALQNYGLTANDQPDSQFTSEGLLALPILQQVVNQHILIFKGEGGRTLLSSTLKARGAEVIEVPVYQRKVPTHDVKSILNAVRGNNVVIVTTSNDSLQNLSLLTGNAQHEWLLQQQLLVISQRQADFAKQLHFIQPALIAADASNQAILAKLKAWYSTHKISSKDINTNG